MTDFIRVGLIDFDSQVRSGRRTVIESDEKLSLVLESSGDSSEVELVADSLVDVLVIEQRLGAWSGLDFVRSLRQMLHSAAQSPEIIVTAPFFQEELRLEALGIGCFDLITLESGPESLVQSILTAKQSSPSLQPQQLYELLESVNPNRFPDFEFLQQIDLLAEVKKGSVRSLQKKWRKLKLGQDFEWEVSRLMPVAQSLGLNSIPELVIRLYTSGQLDET